MINGWHCEQWKYFKLDDFIEEFLQQSTPDRCREFVVLAFDLRGTMRNDRDATAMRNIDMLAQLALV